MFSFLNSKRSIPPVTNPDLISAIAQVHSASTKELALHVAFSLITKKYKGRRFRTYALFWKALETDPNILWQRSGFMHCTQQNYLLRLLLVQSGWFDESDIRLGYSLVWFISPHEFLKVFLHDTWVSIDPWNFCYGASFGTHAVGFGYED